MIIYLIFLYKPINMLNHINKISAFNPRIEAAWCIIVLIYFWILFAHNLDFFTLAVISDWSVAFVWVLYASWFGVNVTVTDTTK